ncbi:FAD-dependent oxidoreductase [Sphingomonas sp.]|uniref:FAD-dependent oxidoreductase n=1 Tax=Sphingomonas sp. TaxID=28214 RepID=UPI00307F94DB
MAVGASFSRLFAHAHVSLVTPEHGFLSGHASAVRRQALAELSKRGILVHFAEAVGDADGLLLSDGTHLPVDCVIAATGSRAPRWLTRSGLARSSGDFVAVGPDLRSTSHPSIFAAGDIIDRVDRDLPRSGVHAVKAGPILAANLRAVLCGAPLRHYMPRARTLYILATGDRRAILSWGKFTSYGSWVWRLKDRIDRHFVDRYRRTVEEAAPR